MDTSRKLRFDDQDVARQVFGPGDSHLRMISTLSGCPVKSRGATVTITCGDNGVNGQADVAGNLLAQLYALAKSGRPVTPEDIEQGWNVLVREPRTSLESLLRDSAIRVTKKCTISPKNVNQRHYLEAIQKNDLIFGIGPAGTGKTYLAVAMAVAALTNKEVKRVVLCRPAVEAGERLGFLPGDLVEKVNPYLRPLYDALHDMLDFGKVQELIDTGRIEIAPLAFMRGRTLNDAFIILDEAQNTTPEQMKMFLTRLGFHSRAVVTGDVTQIDLPAHTSSGLVDAVSVLKGIKGLSITEFNEQDVIRHPLVGRIVQAYDRRSS